MRVPVSLLACLLGSGLASCGVEVDLTPPPAASQADSNGTSPEDGGDPATTAPDTSIDAGPDGAINVSTAVFEFSCNQADCRFECSLDGTDWAFCSSPHSLPGLDDDDYQLAVRAINAHDLVDETPAERTWTVDTVAPETTLLGGPEGVVNASGARFSFHCNEESCSFQCRFDGGSWSGCSSPRIYRALSHGAHSFDVRAVDAAGNVDPDPVRRDWFVDLSGSHWVWIPAGTFLMGTSTDRLQVEIQERINQVSCVGLTQEQCIALITPLVEQNVREFPHPVTLTRDFEIYAWPVTNGEYEACVDAGHCTAPAAGAASHGYGSGAGNDPDRPVVAVNWQQASDFCAWVGGRLPTEAEWEYAARSGTETRFPWGDTLDCDDANYTTSTNWSWDTEPGAFQCEGATLPGRSYAANAWGLFDVVGQVAEWVRDWYQMDYYMESPTHDPQGPASGSLRVRRNADWSSGAWHVRVAHRLGVDPSSQWVSTGFRCVR